MTLLRKKKYWPGFSLGMMAALLWWGLALAQTVVAPERGSALRTELLDTVRPAISKQTGGSVIFVVDTLQVLGDWAYLEADPRRPDGSKIDWRRTKFREAYEADMFSGLVLALLHWQDGRWALVDTFVGPTDVAWLEWVQKYKLPETLFRRP